MKAKYIWRDFLLGMFLANCSLYAIAAELSISLDNPPSTGTVSFLLFDSPNTFGDLRDPVKTIVCPLDNRETYRIENVPPGEYALMVYHDENNNEQIDKNFIGIPKEPLGFSNRYEPKGPPSYSRAAFVLAKGELRHFNIKFYRPLGKRGRLGVGLGVIARSSPYRDYDGGVYQLIPAITYNSERLQIYGPKIQIGLVGSGKLRLAATGKYRIGVYEEDQSDFLEGMGDREDTFMAGLALQAELPGGVDFSLRFEHDVLNAIGGSEASLEFKKSLQYGILRFSPQIGVNWLSSDLSNHDFGVPVSKARPDRPAYDLDDTISLEAGIGMFVEITPNWLVIVNASVELFEDDVTNSPIVEKDYVVKGFAAINYVF